MARSQYSAKPGKAASTPGMLSSETIRITQDDYENYDKILFDITELKNLIEASKSTDEYLIAHYRNLLKKKLYLDHVVFKSDRPSASRAIDTEAELAKYSAGGAKTSSSDDEDDDESRTLINKTQNIPKSWTESFREYLIYLNRIRLDDILWQRSLLNAATAIKPSDNTHFVSMQTSANIMNAYASVGFYVQNAVMTVMQSINHKYKTVDHQAQIAGYNFRQNIRNPIQKKTSTFLGLHKYKLLNDVLWAPINAFYFINQTIPSMARQPYIGDGLCALLFLFDICACFINKKEDEAKYNRLMNDLAQAYLKQMPEVDSNKAISLDKIDINFKHFDESTRNTLKCIAKKLYQDKDVEDTLIEKLKTLPIMKTLNNLNRQKEKNLYEQEKVIYLLMGYLLAMSIILCADVFVSVANNLVLAGVIIGFISKVAYLIKNYYDAIKGLDPDWAEDMAYIQYHRKELAIRMVIQVSYVALFLTVALIAIPGPHQLLIGFAFMGLIILMMSGINKMANNYLEQSKKQLDAPVANQTQEFTPLLGAEKNKHV
jgi:hypothetical protein